MNLKSRICILLTLTSLMGSSLYNGDFSRNLLHWESWNDNSRISGTGKNPSLIISNSDTVWSGVSQKVTIPEGTHYVTVEGRMKTDSVEQGSKSWNTAQITIEFQREGSRLGEYPPALTEKTGTNDWKRYSRSYAVERDSAGPADIVEITCALGACRGTAHFDDLSLVFKNATGDTLHAKKLSGPTDEGRWYPFPAQEASAGSHYVDWSSLLDAPAGKHGFLTTEKDRFVFEDGTPARFYGVVLTGGDCFPAKEKADSLAKRLSMMGCNLVRFHLMDADWAEPNIFAHGTTRSLDTAALKKMDYLFHALKQRGIYSFFDLICAREFLPADSVQNPDQYGAKQVGYFSPELIRLQKEYGKQLFNHVNPYTKKAYRDDPALALYEFINETTLYTQFSQNLITGIYKEQVDSLWEDFGGKAGRRTEFTLNWEGTNIFGILQAANPDSDIQQSIAFYKHLEEKYYRDMDDYFKDTLGVQIPVTGSNMPLPILAMAHSYTTLDYIANDAYWDHPKIWKSSHGWDAPSRAPMENTSQLKNLQTNSITRLAFYPTAKKPFVAWGDQTYPNEYQGEHLPLLTFYSLLQGWDGLVQHSFGYETPGSAPLDVYAVHRQPDDIALWSIMAPAFLRSDIKESDLTITEHIGRDRIFSDSSYSNFIDRNFHIPFTATFERVYGDSSRRPDLENIEKYHDTEEGRITSSTGELQLNYRRGYMKVNSPRLQGVTGPLPDTSVTCRDLTFSFANSFISAYAVAAQDTSIAASDTLYIAVTPPAKMSGQQFNRNRKYLTDLGELPVLCQYAEGSIVLKRKEKPEIRILSPDGSVKKPMSVEKTTQGYRISFSDAESYMYQVVYQ
ncbi:MAG: carbohydrate binding domain-containing protein [Fibrobacterota bacterium]